LYAYSQLLRTIFEIIIKLWWFFVPAIILILAILGWPVIRYVACLICGCQAPIP
jgi:hypothetical protein